MIFFYIVEIRKNIYSMFSMFWSFYNTRNFLSIKKKSTFRGMTLDFLGHTIDNQGVAMQSNKIQTILSWPIPQNVKGVRGFLGLTGYYRKFIQGYGSIAKRLTTLTKKDNFKWGQKTQAAFDQLKRAMVTTPVLQLPDFTQPFEIECDASDKGIGAVLMQNKHPIAYFNKALSKRSLAKSTYEREIMQGQKNRFIWPKYCRQIGYRLTLKRYWQLIID